MTTIEEHSPNGAAPAAIKPARPVDAGHTRPPSSRLQIVWRHKVLVLIIGLLFALAGAGYALLRPHTYTANSTVQVTLLQTADAGEQNALAANELAAQYAQVATTAPVVALARKSIGNAAAHIATEVTAAPINNYNIIGITATGANRVRVAKEARAVAHALVSFLNTQQKTATAAANADTVRELASLDTQIAALQKQIATDTATALGKGTRASRAAASLPSERSLLASLVSNRSTTFTAPQRDFLQSQPVLSITSTPQTAAPVSSQAGVFALGGLLVGLVVAAELCVLGARIRVDTRARRHDSSHQ